MFCGIVAETVKVEFFNPRNSDVGHFFNNRRFAEIKRGQKFLEPRRKTLVFPSSDVFWAIGQIERRAPIRMFLDYFVIFINMVGNVVEYDVYAVLVRRFH